MVRWHCPPDAGLEIWALSVWERARYLSITEAPHNIESLRVSREETFWHTSRTDSFSFSHTSLSYTAHGATLNVKIWRLRMSDSDVLVSMVFMKHLVSMFCISKLHGLLQLVDRHRHTCKKTQDGEPTTGRCWFQNLADMIRLHIDTYHILIYNMQHSLYQIKILSKLIVPKLKVIKFINDEIILK